MTIDEKNIGVAVKSLRTARGLTQSELANKLGVSVNFLSQLENGRRGPSITTLNQLAEILEVPAPIIALMGAKIPADKPVAAKLLQQLQRLVKVTVEADAQHKTSCAGSSS